MLKFKDHIKIIGINPYVSVPERILKKIFEQAGKDKGHIRIKGTVNGEAYKQTLVKYSGEWRLYINTIMLKDSPKRIGEKIELTVEFDSEGREVPVSPEFLKVLKKDKDARQVFDALSPSRQNEIMRYLASLKTKESLDRNIVRAINFLHGKERFMGRDRP
ncbi:YdeI/OmpD-associated family protein [Dawidia soli]|uniref:YdeI/OmpD-associated family protein n=1 Tax=Dawidia soli TaxID=2782352 RepID=A0AAP2D4K7_9BACT|nr:YdeI/OmpD-associated family protein [Dawidia soli]MBT1685203.1 YdeI/OmpD-associated family protein [Dawidia soli]